MKRYRIHDKSTDKIVFESNDHMECTIELEKYKQTSKDNFEIIDTQKKQ